MTIKDQGERQLEAIKNQKERQLDAIERQNENKPKIEYLKDEIDALFAVSRFLH